eukprot:scaffold7720_cov129-Isochrysis_galbana.AAC.12
MEEDEGLIAGTNTGRDDGRFGYDGSTGLSPPPRSSHSRPPSHPTPPPETSPGLSRNRTAAGRQGVRRQPSCLEWSIGCLPPGDKWSPGPGEGSAGGWSRQWRVGQVGGVARHGAPRLTASRNLRSHAGCRVRIE